MILDINLTQMCKLVSDHLFLMDTKVSPPEYADARRFTSGSVFDYTFAWLSGVYAVYFKVFLSGKDVMLSIAVINLRKVLEIKFERLNREYLISRGILQEVVA